MNNRKNIFRHWMAFGFILILAAAVISCGSDEEPAPVIEEQEQITNEEEVVEEVPEPTETPVRYPQSAEEIDFITVAIDAPSRNRDFAAIDEYGRVQGFDPDLMADIAAHTGIDVEFVVTNFDGMLDSVADGEFDAAISEIIIPGEVPEGIVFTNPYLSVGQVLVVRANNDSVNSPADLSSDNRIGVEAASAGAQTARTVLNIRGGQIFEFESTPAALQGLIDQEVDAVIVDSDDATQYANNYYQQLRIAGEEASGAWISSRNYGIVVAEENQILLDVLNKAINEARTDGTVDRLSRAWLTNQDRLVAGESLIGTLDRELVVGMVAESINMDPIAGPDAISWELKTNTMSGLVGYTPDNEMVPLLAESLPSVSANGLEYIFTLKQGLIFPDGSELSAEDVRFSFLRASAGGNFLVNAFLKDENIDGFADEDSVEIVDDLTIRINLDEAASHFLSVLATPAFFVISDECYPFEADPESICGGIGPYQIQDWAAGDQVRLKANPQWPGAPPAFENIQLRFYVDGTQMRNSLESGAIDVAWLGLPLADLIELRDNEVYKEWQGPAAFKSYLVFEHDTPPWNNALVRQAAALAIDRAPLANIFQGTRLPLYSPVPDTVPGHQSTQPTRDLEQAITLLNRAGYTEENKAIVTIDYTNDDRYSTFEEEYAQLLADQLEETGIFDVTLRGAAYDSFRATSATCQSGAFLLGWPPSGQPPNYIDPAHWTYYFLFNTGGVCSNFEDLQMSTTISSLELLDPTDTNS
ncbi:MAG: ABC transporter substrate-binding protein, partial [Chloroflexota bacterium]